MTATARIVPFVVTTKPFGRHCNASTVRFMYLEHVPFRCTASSMQLVHFPDRHEADFRRPIPATHVWHPEAAPTEGPHRIRPGDRLSVGGDVFEVHVQEGYDSIFPYLRRV